MSSLDLEYYRNLVITEPSAIRNIPPRPIPAREGDTLQIRATTGLGKTRAVIEELSSAQQWRDAEVHYHVPTHELAREIEELACAAGHPRVRRIFGRSSSSESPAYCARFSVADRVGEIGLNVYRTYCQEKVREEDVQCPHFDSCPYLKQWDDQKPALRIFVHNYVFLPKPKRDGVGLPKPSLAVIDESVLGGAMERHAFSVNKLPNPYRRAAQVNLEDGTDFITALKRNGIDQDKASGRALWIESQMTAGLRPDLPDDVSIKRLGKMSEGELKAVAAFFWAVAY